MLKKRFVDLSNKINITVSFPKSWNKNTLRNRISNEIDDASLKDIKILGISHEFPDLEFDNKGDLALSFAHM